MKTIVKCLQNFWQNFACDSSKTKEISTAEQGSNLGPRMLMDVMDKEVTRGVLPHMVIIPSVTTLKEAGVTLKHKDKLPFWDVEFKGRVLEIPQIMIHDLTKSILVNLMAFELCHIQMRKWKITPYILFMDCLVNSASDVAELRAQGIIVAIRIVRK